MEAVFSLILDMSLTASWVIAAILLIRLSLKKAPKKYSYALWIVAAFRLICPVSIESAFSLFNLSFSVGKTTGVTLQNIPEHSISEYIVPAQPTAAPGIPDTPSTFIPDLLPSPTPGTIYNVPIVPTEPKAAISLMGILAIIWCVGMAALLIYSVVSYIKLRRRMCTAVLLEDNVRQASGIRSPFILGFIRPQIYIPYHLSESEMSYVLAHERFHMKRRDHIVKPLAFLILVLHWFNPLVWLAFCLMVRDMEMSCDEKVLSNDESIRKDYSSTLLSFAAGRAFPAPSPLSFGEGSVKSRIKNVLSWKKPALWLTAAAIIICIAVIAVCGTNPRVILPADKITEASANGEEISLEAAEALTELINSHSKTAHYKAPADVGSSDSRVLLVFEDGSRYYLHHWYCSGFSFNPAHFGEDDYYTILSRLDDNGNPEKSWKMEYDFDAVFLNWLEANSLRNSFPMGSEFSLGYVYFSTGCDTELPLYRADTIRVTDSRAIYADSEVLGTLELITLTEDNWDNYFSDDLWTLGSFRELRKGNSRAWRAVSGDDMYYLLLQTDGSVFAAGGYYDSEGELDPYSDDSNISYVYELVGKDSAIRWQYVPYEEPDHFPLKFDFEYTGIRFAATEGSIRALDASGTPIHGTDIEVSAQCTEIGWVHPIDANMNASLRQEGNRKNDEPFAEIFFTAALPDGETLSGTVIISRPDKGDRYLYEITLTSDNLSIKRDPEGGAVIYRSSAATAVIEDIFAPVSCFYTAPHSSYYAWGGDSGCRYIIGSDSITVERMDGSSTEVIPFDNWNYRVLDPYSSQWTEKFIGSAPTFENIDKPLYLQLSDKYFLLNLDGQLCIGSISGSLVWDIYAIVPEAQLGSAVWEYRPELSSRSPWFVFEFDMEYDNLQITASSGDLSSDGSRVNGKELSIPAGYTARWSPLGRFQPSAYAQLQFTLTLNDGRIMQGTIYISSEDGTLYTAALHANGLRLSNDEEYGHAVIGLTKAIGADDISSLIADRLRANFELGRSLYLTPYIAGQGKQETLQLTHRDDISGYIRNCRLSPIEAPSTEPSDYWIEISGIVSDTKITVWHGSIDTLELTTEDGTQYFRIMGESLAETLMQVYSAKAPYPTTVFATNLDELLNQWQTEGVTTLSAEQLERLNKNFIPLLGEGNPLSNFFVCYYERPEEINLAAFLQYNFVAYSEYTEEEFYALKQKYPNHGQLAGSDSYEDAVKYHNPIHKHPRELVDEQLMRYAGITTADLTSDIDWENSGLVYLPESDAYFNFTSDMAAGGYSAESGEIVGDTVYLRNGYRTLTLRKNGDVWLIYSHTYDSDAATTAYLANSIIELFDVGGQMNITEYNGYNAVTLTVTDRSIAERYGNILESFHFTKVDAPIEPIDATRLEFTPTQPTNRLIIWDTETPLLRYSPRGRHEYYTFTSDVYDSLFDELYKSYDGLLQQKYLEENSTYTTDINELLNKWQAEGVTTLSTEQLTQLNKNFIATSWNQNSSGIASTNPLSGFFSCYYERPEDIDLREFLKYNFDLDIGFTDDDFDLLKQHNVQIADLPADATYEDAVRLQTPIHKYPRKKVDSILTQYAGIATGDLSRETNMVYLDEFNSYYNFTSDYGPLSFRCSAGKIDGDTVYLSDNSATLTLRKNGDRWLIYSHIFYGSVELH